MFCMRTNMPYRDRDQQRAYGREWMKRNVEKAREAMRRWRNNHPAEHAEDSREYYRRHREQALAQSVEYHRAHPEVRKAADNRRRVNELLAGPSFTPAEWLQLVEQYGGRCAYCGASGRLHAEHRIPVSRGGSNRIENILPACASCNAKKATMTEEEFRARLAKEQSNDLES